MVSHLISLRPNFLISKIGIMPVGFAKGSSVEKNMDGKPGIPKPASV